ncbi:MAG: hypothetical protein AB7S26_02665 [Sandaracinaceae bacterium]
MRIIAVRAFGCAIAAALLAGCSPLIGLVVRATQSTGGDIRVGDTRRGNTTGGSDSHTPACGAAGAPDHAYTFVPERGGTYRIAVDAGYDCMLAVVDDAGQSVACNDDAGSTSHSEVEPRLEAGRRYTIVVDGYSGGAGSYTLSLSAMSLDPLLVVGDGHALVVGQEHTGDTTAGADTRTPPCGSSPGSPDEVWSFDPPATGRYRIDVASDFDGTLAVYPPGASEPIACNDDEGTTRASRVEVDLSAGTRYAVVVDGYQGASGHYRIRVSSLGGGVVGGNALTLGGSVRGDTTTGQDRRTPDCGSTPGSPEQTYTLTVPRSGPVQLHVDAEFDSVLAIYEQGSMTPLACNDDFEGTRQSRLVAPLVAGQTYEVVVDGYSGSSGPFMLSATELTSTGGGPITLGQTVNGNTAARANTRDPGCGSGQGTADEMWVFTAPSDGMYRFHVDAEYDSVLALYTSNNPAAPFACNDDFGSTRASRIETSLSAGQRVEVLVDGFGSGSGTYRLQVTPMGPPVPTYPPAPASIENINAMETRCAAAGPAVTGSMALVIPAGTSDARTTCGGGGGGREELYTIQVQQPTTITVTAQSPVGPVLELRSGCSRGHTVVACDGSVPNASLTARLQPNTRYTLVVDTRAAADAEVQLDVQMVP